MMPGRSVGAVRPTGIPDEEDEEESEGEEAVVVIEEEGGEKEEAEEALGDAESVVVACD